MKPAKKIITPRARKTRLRKFSKHWLEAVRLSDMSVLADSGTSSDGGSGGTIIQRVWDPSQSSSVVAPALGAALVPLTAPSAIRSTAAFLTAAAPVALTAAVVAAVVSPAIASVVSPTLNSSIWGVGAFISPWSTKKTAANPPVFNFSTSFIRLVMGGHTGKIAIEHVAGGSNSGVGQGTWQLVASLDGVKLVSVPYNYHGANQSYLEIDVSPDGTWTFWGEFGSLSRKVVLTGGESYADYGCSAGKGDYLMYNSFTNCAVNYGGSQGWSTPNFAGRSPLGEAQFTTAKCTQDSIIFHDNPPY